MKLRLNLRDQDLSLGVLQSTVSRSFRKWIDILYIQLLAGQPVKKCLRQYAIWFQKKI